MIRHRILLEKEIELLRKVIVNTTLAECFSQDKNRIVMRFLKGIESIFVETSIDLQIGYTIILNEFNRAKKNTIDFFNDALGEKIVDINIHHSERVVNLMLSNNKCISIIFFGSGNGNVIFTNNNLIQESFQKFDNNFDDILFGELQEEVTSFSNLYKNILLSDENALKTIVQLMPQIGRRIALESLFRSNLDPNFVLKNIDKSVLDLLLNHIDIVYSECELSNLFYIYYTQNEVIFVPTKFLSLEEKSVKVESFDNLNKAIRTYRAITGVNSSFELLRKQMLNKVTDDIEKLQATLKKKIKIEELEKKAFESDEIGKLIIANIFRIEKGAKKIEVTNFYDQQFEIFLDENLTAVENAERYFRKSKNSKLAIVKNELDLVSTKKRRDILMRLEFKVKNSKTIKELESIKKDNSKSFRPVGEAHIAGAPERFRKFIVNEKYEIYAGKNATNNDELTTKFARQNDYWFHARGSSGSHVILKWDNLKEKPTKELIKTAASIAAYFSGAKNSKMVSVAYTLKKYVRKPKGSAIGSVIIDKEEVLLVEPKLP